MKFPRRVGQGLVAAALLFGVATPAFGAGTLTWLHNYNLGDRGYARQIESTFGDAGTHVTASRNMDGKLRVQSFYTDASHDFVAQDVETHGAITDVDIANIDYGFVVVAVRMPDDTLKLIPFDPNDGANGRSATRLNDGFDRDNELIELKSGFDLEGHSRSAVEIVRIGGLGRFVTAAVQPDSTVRIDSWLLDEDGVISWVDTYETTLLFDQIVMAGDYSASASKNFVTVLREQGDSQPWLILWELSNTGQIVKLDTEVRTGPMNGGSVTLSGARMYVSMINDTTQLAEIQDWDVVGGQISHQAEANIPNMVTDVEIVDMGSGGVVVSRKNNGWLQMTPFTMNSNGAFVLQGSVQYGSAPIHPSLTITKDDGERFFVSSISVVGTPSTHPADHDIYRFTY